MCKLTLLTLGLSLVMYEDKANYFEPRSLDFISSPACKKLRSCHSALTASKKLNELKITSKIHKGSQVTR